MIRDWQKCDEHGGFGFKSDCLVCKGEAMSDADLIEQIEYALCQNKELSEIINMVRANDKHDHASFALDITEKAREDERAKIVAEGLKSLDQSFDDCDLTITKWEAKEIAQKAIKGLGDD